LEAAGRRFTSSGYTGTSVRDIADDAGVNVALISRYFGSKEALFRACLTGVADELERTVVHTVTLDQVADLLADQVIGTNTDGEPSRLMLFLRSSGKEADQIRFDVLRSGATRLAAIAARDSGTTPGRLEPRAQAAIAAALGVAQLRTAGVEPLASTDRDELAELLRGIIRGLLEPTAPE
jgi:AcrR family transcriptional regulator